MEMKKYRSTASLPKGWKNRKSGKIPCSRIFQAKKRTRTVSLHFPPPYLESFAERLAVTRTEGSLRLSGHWLLLPYMGFWPGLESFPPN